MMSDPTQVQFFSYDDADALQPVPGIEMRAVYGAGASVNLVHLAAGAELPLHSHPHEQIGIVLEGVQVLIVGGREHRLRGQRGLRGPGRCGARGPRRPRRLPRARRLGARARGLPLGGGAGARARLGGRSQHRRPLPGGGGPLDPGGEPQQVGLAAVAADELQADRQPVRR